MKKYIITLLIILSFTKLAKSQEESEYYKVLIRTGETPQCFTFKPRYDYKLDNFLKIDASNCSDIVIKIMDNYTHECIRCVFIEGGDIHFINNIPEGVYYLKIAYGYDWGKRVSGSFCFSKFLRDAHYEEGTDLLNYYLKETYNGYQVPSYELVLRIISSNRKNEFESEEISEEEFYR